MTQCHTAEGVHIPGCWDCVVYGHSRCTCKWTPKTTLPPNAIVLDCIKELQAFAAWIRREHRTRPTILKALDARVAYLQGVATQTVDVSGASATMQAGGVPRRGQHLPDATLVRSASDMTNSALDSGAAAELRWPCGGWRGYPTPESE